eukprot:758546-Hanusia_phi.AAC.2
MQKDEYYVALLKACHTTQAVLGARALTSANPTLGEEYCEVREVDSPNGHSSTPSHGNEQVSAHSETSASKGRRAVFIVWKLIVPYVSKDMCSAGHASPNGVQTSQNVHCAGNAFRSPPCCDFTTTHHRQIRAAEELLGDQKTIRSFTNMIFAYQTSGALYLGFIRILKPCE